jgi:hypothetical protein
MNARHCRKKAEEFAQAADTIQDDFRARLGWLILSNAWFSLADTFDKPLLRRPGDRALSRQPQR